MLIAILLAISGAGKGVNLGVVEQQNMSAAVAYSAGSEGGVAGVYHGLNEHGIVSIWFSKRGSGVLLVQPRHEARARAIAQRMWFPGAKFDVIPLEEKAVASDRADRLICHSEPEESDHADPECRIGHKLVRR